MAVKFSGPVNGLRVRRVWFEPCTGVNTVWAAGQVSSDFSVEDNYFKFAKSTKDPAAPEPFYDNSDIYLEAKGIRVHNNHLVVDESGGPYYQQYANGGIEVHGPNAVVSDNFVDGYAAGLFVVTPFNSGNTTNVATDTSDITVTGNVFRRCNWGIGILAADTTTPAVVHAAIRKVSITGNTFDIHQLDHNRASCYGLFLSAGTVNNPIEDVSYLGNPVTFQPGDTRTTDQWGNAVQTIESGVYAYGNGPVRRLNLIGNTFRNAPWQGIGLGFTENSTVALNRVIDCGTNASHPFPAYRTGISLGFGSNSNLTDISCVNNFIEDTGGTLNGQYAIAANNGSGTVTRCRIGPNYVRSVAASFPSTINRTGKTWDEGGFSLLDANSSGMTLDAAAGYAGNFVDYRVAGASVFKIGPTGILNPAGTTSGATFSAVPATNNAGLIVGSGGNGVASVFVGAGAGFFQKIINTSGDTAMRVDAPVATAGATSQNGGFYTLTTSFWNGSASVTEAANFRAVRRSTTANDMTLDIDKPVTARGFGGTIQTLTYGATVNTDPNSGSYCKVTANNGTAFTIAAPSPAPTSTQAMELTYKITNSSGGALGAITWNAAFKLAGAFTNPANGTSRTITFRWDGGNWVENARAAGDI
jgi:hypothetical protein